MPRTATRRTLSRRRTRRAKPPQMTELERKLIPVQIEKARRRHEKVTSQRERIQAAFLACQHRLPDGRVVFLPEPRDITEEHADLCRALALELLDLARREKGRWRERDRREGKRLNRAEILHEDVEEGMAKAEYALHQYRNCPPHLAERWLGEFLSAAERMCGAIVGAQGLLELAGYPPQARPKVKELLEARLGDAREMDQIRASLGAALSRAQEAVAERDQVLRLVRAAQRGDKRAGKALADLTARLG